jgi:zinc transport system substrate-binding protein
MIFALAATSASPVGADPLVVYSVNYPLAFFAERIGGDGVDVRFPAPPDVDPAFWSPSTEQVLQYQAADLVLRNGAKYARWTRQASLPRRTQVDTSRGLRERYLPGAAGVVHAHGTTGAHSHSGVAFTTWLDPLQAVEQMRAVEAALLKHRPDVKSELAERADALEADLRALDRELELAFKPWRGRDMLASHPVYGYLGRRYDVSLRSLIWEPEATPDAAGWSELDALLAEQPSGTMLWEAEPTPETRAGLESRGVAVVVFSPCANRPQAGDYLSVMRANASALRDATP